MDNAACAVVAAAALLTFVMDDAICVINVLVVEVVDVTFIPGHSSSSAITRRMENKPMYDEPPI